VKIPSIPTGNSIIYVYYGNPSASAGSSVSNTFSSGSFTDSFTDATEISTSDSNNYSVSGGQVKLGSAEAVTDTYDANDPRDHFRVYGNYVDPSWSDINGKGDSSSNMPTHMTEASSTDYADIAADDSDEWYAYQILFHRVAYIGHATIDEDASNISQLHFRTVLKTDVLISSTVYLYVWKYGSTNNWDGGESGYKASHYQYGGTATLDWTCTSNISDYISSTGQITFMVRGVSDRQQSLDYAKVDVTYRPYQSSGSVKSVAVPMATNARLTAGKLLTWNDTEPTNSDIKYQVQYYNSTWQLIPDSVLPGNSTGFDTSGVDISSVKAAYSQIRLVANMSTSDNLISPSIQDWTITYYYRKYAAVEPSASAPGIESLSHCFSGSIASKVFDTGKNGALWRSLSWTETLPAGADIVFEVRASDTLFAKDAVSPTWVSAGSTSLVTTGLPSGRYQQWRATLTTSGTGTPVLGDVMAMYS
jgi:hypothetical protein